MSTAVVVPRKSLSERVVHALLFKGLVLLLFSPLGALVSGKSLAHSGALTLMMSFVAVLWNMLFSAGFESLERRRGWRRTLRLRLAHACLFEVGLIVALVPMIAWWMQVDLLQALMLDIGLVLLFLPYTLMFNWLYDRYRSQVMACWRVGPAS